MLLGKHTIIVNKKVGEEIKNTVKADHFALKKEAEDFIAYIKNMYDVEIIQEGGWYICKDKHTGVASQGETEEEAYKNFCEAMELYRSTL